MSGEQGARRTRRGAARRGATDLARVVGLVVEVAVALGGVELGVGREHGAEGHVEVARAHHVVAELKARVGVHHREEHALEPRVVQPEVELLVPYLEMTCHIRIWSLNN